MNDLPLPRGIRNNNPGNVEWHPTTDPWQGIDAGAPSDGRFCRFTDAVWGIRVIGKLLWAYHNYHHCYSVMDFIQTWAPSSENDTVAYAKDVCREIGLSSIHDVVNLADPHAVLALCKGIIRHENGTNPYTDATILAGLALAHPNAPAVSVPA